MWVEALTAALFSLVAWRLLVLEAVSPAACVVLWAFVASLVVASFIDLELRILPDEITIGGLILAVPAILLVPDAHGSTQDPLVPPVLRSVSESLQGFSASLPAALRGGIGLVLVVGVASGLGALGGYLMTRRHFRRAFGEERSHLLGETLGAVLGASVLGGLLTGVLRPDLLVEPRALALWGALAGMLAGSGLVYGIGLVGSWVFRKQAMGFGDVKLMGLLGAFTGWLGVIEGFFVACFVGSGVGIYLKLRHRSQYIPFGPFLASGCLLILLWPGAFEAILEWYVGLFR